MPPQRPHRRTARTALVFSLAACAAALAWLPSGAPASSGLPGANGKLAFHSARGGDQEIYVMNTDGTAQTNVSNNAMNDRDPAWSPDGSRIAFAGDVDGDWEIYVMNADGTAQARLTDNGASDRYPAWSPDGSRIAFESSRTGSGEVFVMNADGTSQTNLTNNAVDDGLPGWSPDGSRIAFESMRTGNNEIYVMNADGTAPTNLTNNAAPDGDPAWSPDGAKIAFSSARDEPLGEVYIMNADGTGATRLTTNLDEDGAPAWSPDGAKIAFLTDRDFNFEVYSMNTDGTSQTNLTANAAEDFSPSWQPLPNDLAVAASVDPSTVKLDGQATYTFTATNSGSAPAPGVSLSLTPPEGGELVSASSNRGTCQSGAAVSCSLGTLGPGTSATVTLVERATRAGTATAQGAVAGYGADANAANNGAQASSSVVSVRVRLPRGLRSGRTKRISRRALYRRIVRGFVGEAEGVVRLRGMLTRRQGGRCQRIGTRTRVSCSRTSARGMTFDTAASPAEFRYRPLRSRRRAARILRRGRALRKGIYRLAIEATPEAGEPVTFVFRMRAV